MVILRLVFIAAPAVEKPHFKCQKYLHLPRAFRFTHLFNISGGSIPRPQAQYTAVPKETPSAVL
jgi:hypothetical protein